MAIYALGDLVPDIHPSVFVHPQATIIGAVTIGANSSVWPQAVLRGDYGPITIGEGTNVQDGAVIHSLAEIPTVIGNGVVIGHLAHMECCTIEDGALIGSNSVVLHRVVVGTGALVGAGALVPNDMQVPPGAMALGVPAKLRLDASNPEFIRANAAAYAENAQRYRRELRRLDTP